MTKLALLAAAAVVTSLAAGPALAKDAAQTDAQSIKTHKVQKQPRAQMRRDDRRSDRSYDRGFNRGYDRGMVQGENFDRNLNRTATTTYYGGRTFDNSYNTGFWPADAAADIATDAVETAGVIATAPFRDTYAYDNSYAYNNSYAAAPVYRTGGWDNGWNNGWDNNWARRQSVQEGGFACTPGSYYTNSYGYTQLCQ